MIEISDYRTAERTARAVIKSWWVAQTHTVDHFQNIGFPVRIESRHEIGQLIDTMQEKRFGPYMNELNGINHQELDKFMAALCACVKMQISFLPQRQPLVPLSTMISSFALYRKIMASKPDVRSVLEIGGGCGYLGFFLGQEKQIRNFSLSEACESFYIMQDLVNTISFGHEFRQMVLRRIEDSAISTRSDFEQSIALLPSEEPPPRCFQYPWWKLGDLYMQNQSFDIVTSNANLTEFSSNALKDYLNIFQRVLKDDGIFVVQCTGCGAGTPLNRTFDLLYEAGFAPLFIWLSSENLTETLIASSNEAYRENGFDKKNFVTNNMLMIKNGHAMFADNYRHSNFRHGYASSFERLGDVYSRTAGGFYSAEEIVSALKSVLIGNS